MSLWKWQWKKIMAEVGYFFVTFHLPSKYFVPCFGICVPERKRTEGMQETQQYNPAMWWPPLHNPPTHYCLQHPPTIVVLCNRSHSFNTKAKHKPPASTNTVFTTKTRTQTMKMQLKNTGNRTYFRKLPLNRTFLTLKNISNFLKEAERAKLLSFWFLQ